MRRYTKLLEVLNWLEESSLPYCLKKRGKAIVIYVVEGNQRIEISFPAEGDIRTSVFLEKQQFEGEASLESLLKELSS